MRIRKRINNGVKKIVIFFKKKFTNFFNKPNSRVRLEVVEEKLVSEEPIFTPQKGLLDKKEKEVPNEKTIVEEWNESIQENLQRIRRELVDISMVLCKALRDIMNYFMS